MFAPSLTINSFESASINDAPQISPPTFCEDDAFVVLKKFKYKLKSGLDGIILYRDLLNGKKIWLRTTLQSSIKKKIHEIVLYKILPFNIIAQRWSRSTTTNLQWITQFIANCLNHCTRICPQRTNNCWNCILLEYKPLVLLVYI